MSHCNGEGEGVPVRPAHSPLEEREIVGDEDEAASFTVFSSGWALRSGREA